jgi:hypothetical protein
MNRARKGSQRGSRSVHRARDPQSAIRDPIPGPLKVRPRLP